MKKIFNALFVSALTLAASLPALAGAALYLPKNISIGDALLYDAGSTVTVTFQDDIRPVGKMTNIEYGVAEAIVDGSVTRYAKLTGETKDIADLDTFKTLTLEVPNLLSDSGDSSYVVYIKYFEKDNPNATDFFITKKFKIKENATLFTNVRGVRILKSTGESFIAREGTTIYSPEYAAEHPAERLGTTTSLQLTFESNQDVTLKPILTFSKLRSNAFRQEFTPDPVTVKKGTSSVVIPLPTFNYEPGIYIGNVRFADGIVNSNTEIQYIIGGEVVTVGEVNAVEKDGKNVFEFAVFQQPIDNNRAPTVYGSSSVPGNLDQKYTVQTDYLNKRGRVVESFTGEVDFAGQTFVRDIPQGLVLANTIEDIHVIVTNKEGKVIYEGTKNVSFKSEPRLPVDKIGIALLIVLLIALLVALRRRKRELIALVVLIALVISGILLRNRVFSQAAPTSPTVEQVKAETDAKNAQLDMSFVTYGTNAYWSQFPQQQYVEPKGWVMNQPQGLRLPGKEPYSVFTPSPGNQTDGTGAYVAQGIWSDRNTQLFTAGFLPDYTYQCGEPITAKVQYRVNSCFNEAGSSSAALWWSDEEQPRLKVIYDTGEAYDHNKTLDILPFFTVTHAPTLAENLSMKAVTIQILRWWDKYGYQARQGGRWDYDLPINTNCSIMPQTCTCNGRTQVCTKGGLQVSSTPNSPSCQLQASCTISPVDKDTTSVTFTQNVKNAGGTITFKGVTTNASGATERTTEDASKTLPIAPGQTITKVTEIMDSIDGSATKTECSVTRPSADIKAPIPPVSASCSCSADGTKTCTYSNGATPTVTPNSCTPAKSNCGCTGRTYVCKDTDTGKTTRNEANSSQCAFTAACTLNEIIASSNQAKFTFTYTNRLGSVSLKDKQTGQTVNNTMPLAPGGSVVRNVIATDSDGSTFETTCVATRSSNTNTNTNTNTNNPGTDTNTNTPGTDTTNTEQYWNDYWYKYWRERIKTTNTDTTNPGTDTNTNTNTPGENTTTPGGNTNTSSSWDYINNTNTITDICTFPSPIIVHFSAVPSLVRKGDACNFVWSTVNINTCTLNINGVNQPLTTDTGPFVLYSKPTVDGRNQVAKLTCTKYASGKEPAKTLTANATCTVQPTIIQY